VLVRDFPKTFTFNPAYLTDYETGRWESSSQTVDLSKEFRALKIWFTFKYLGADRISEYIDHDVQMTQYFADRLKKTGVFEVEPTHPLSILCFRVNYAGMKKEDNRYLTTAAIAAIEKDNRIFLTGTRLHGEPYLRAYYGNPSRTKADVDYMVEVLVEIVKGLT
jgi:glutamate/tyrosine decarboxylase-like PLP-dependent enzyme